MDYIIQFSAAEVSGALALLALMASQSPEITLANGAYSVASGGTLRPEVQEAITLSGATDSALFDVLTAYFQVVDGANHGALVTVVQDGAITMVAFSDDDVTMREQFELGFVVPASEILSNREAFLAAWPMLLQSHLDAMEDAAQEGETVTTANGRDEMVFDGLLPDEEAETDLVSFMVFGTTADRVMETLVGAGTYVREDPSFLRLDLENREGSIEVVGFDTDRGFGLELRLPLEQAKVRDAIFRLAARAHAASMDVHYVVEIVDDEEVFVLQKMERDGFLQAPERIQLQ